MPDECLISDLPYAQTAQKVHRDIYVLLVGIKVDAHPKPLRLAVTDFSTNDNIGKYNAMELPGGHLDAFKVFQVDAYNERLSPLFSKYHKVFQSELVNHNEGSDDMIPLAHKLCMVKIRVQLKVYDGILEGRCVSISLADADTRHHNFSRLLVQLATLYPQLVHENQQTFDTVNGLLGNPVLHPETMNLSRLGPARTEQPAQTQIKMEALEAGSLQFPDRQTTPQLQSSSSSQDPSDSENENDHMISFDGPVNTETQAPQQQHQRNPQHERQHQQHNQQYQDHPHHQHQPPQQLLVAEQSYPPSQNNTEPFYDEPWTVHKLLQAKESEISDRTITVSAYVVATIPNDWTLVCAKNYFLSRGNKVEVGDPFYRSLEFIISDSRPQSKVLDPQNTLSVRLQDEDLELFFNNASVEYNYTHMEGQSATLRYPDEPLQLHLYRKDVKISYSMHMPMWSARGLYMSDLVG